MSESEASDKSAETTEQPACPEEMCGNPELDNVEDEQDGEYEFFCPWCGELFEPGEVEA